MISCDLLKIHYLCGDKDNLALLFIQLVAVVICSKFITFAVTKTIHHKSAKSTKCCDLLKIHYLCGDKDNCVLLLLIHQLVVICSKFITFAVTKTISKSERLRSICCDLLKIHYLCGDKDNRGCREASNSRVVICSKFITFAVTKTIANLQDVCSEQL